MGGFIFDVGLLGPCGKHAEEAKDVAKACLGRCEACQGGRGRCQASLHILGSHTAHFELPNKFFSLKNKKKIFLKIENKGKKQLPNIP